MTYPTRSDGLLLVDTNVVFRDELAGALERIAVPMVWRARVLGLLESIAETRPMAVALSSELPGCDPIELIRAVRARERWHHLPLYLVGSNTSRAMELEAFVEGADAVLDRDSAATEIAARALRLARSRSMPATAVDSPVDARAVADAALALCPTGYSPKRVAEAEAPCSDIGRPAFLIDETMAAEDVAFEMSLCGSCEPCVDGVGEDAPCSPAVPIEILPIGVSQGAPRPGHADLPSAEVLQNGRGQPARLSVVPDVVIVEDDPALLEMLRYALTNRGYRTLSFSNGLDALRSLREMRTFGRKPVVLLDVDLPGIDGFRVLHELSLSRPGDYQILLCTIHNSEATQVLGIQSGALDYLVKPLRMPIVLAKVERLVGQGSFESAAQA